MRIYQQPQTLDQKLFKELDKHSKKLRKAANDFAVFLTKIEDPNHEWDSVINGLKNISLGNIDRLDKTFESLGKKFLQINLKMNDHHFNCHMGHELKIEFYEKYQHFFKEAYTLLEEGSEYKNL